MYKTIKLDNQEYKLVPDGSDKPIAYRMPISDELIHLLEAHRRNKTRLRFHWGDIETGQDWGETFDVSGFIGLSRGRDARYPLLIYNKRSFGGGILPVHCIVKITTSLGKKPIYTHPEYKKPEKEIERPELIK